MKSAVRYLVGAVAAAVLGGLCFAVGMLQRDMAGAQRAVARQQYDDADATYQKAERYLELSSHMPWVGNGPVNDVRARRAALHYWQHQYGTLLTDQADPTIAVPADNVDLQVIVA